MSLAIEPFLKAEDNQHIKDRYHGQGGLLKVSSHAPGNPLVERYFAAAEEIGIPYNPDFNGASQEGCGPLQATLLDGVCCSAAAAYLHPARTRPNLTVLTHALATRLLFGGHRAEGVEYLRFGQVERAFATGEVIVSAGALRSPQLLMLSGIGPAAALQKLGIRVRVDLPGVGQNLQDHVHTRVRCEIRQPWTYAGLDDVAPNSPRWRNIKPAGMARWPPTFWRPALS
jgi:choline dehydrogenase